MALLENLVAGNIYIVKISASNEVGEGPFSNSVGWFFQRKLLSQIRAQTFRFC